ncbi:chemotaxis protein CheW [Cohnella soli]|uniref:Chemotaxis protein CheA n=1 Tax=Cohnella soli TaxID=425005 RepID=A0ABW0HTH7_9BACL
MDSFASTYLSVFLDELEEQLQTLDHAILELENGGEGDTVQRIFRAAHTLKGSSAAMGFTAIKDVTHKVESVFDLLRQGRLTVSGPLIDTLFRCIDDLKKQKEALKVGQVDDKADPGLMDALEKILAGKPLDDEGGESGAEPETAAPNNAIGNETTDEAELSESSPGIRWRQGELEEMAKKRRENVPLHMVSVTLAKEADMPTVRGMLVHRALSETGEVLAIHPPLNEWDNEELLVSAPISFVVASERSASEIEGNVLQLSQLSEARVAAIDDLLASPVNELPLDSGTTVPASEETEIHMPEAPSEAKEKPEAVAGVEGKVQVQQTVRVDVKRLEHLLNLVGELIIDNTRLQEVRKRLDTRGSQQEEGALLGEVADHLNRVIAELQEGMMKTRMLPIEQLFNRFPRLVRDLSQQAGKEIHFTIEGKETELDRTLIEEISDPLIHILRNAADHGLEAPETRERLGKPRKGNLRLQAMHQENAIVIRVTDDGRGIDARKIKQKALERGDISQEEAARMSDKEAIGLIFRSGMSTAEKVTELSGRGVGMDIVRTQIEKLNGLIDIDTELGQGTIISIKLPLTLAITRSLLVELGKHTLAIPLVHVLETFQLSNASIQRVHGKEVCTVRGDIYPLVRLHDRLGTEPRADGKGYAVMIGAAEKRVCLYVDKLVANQEIVMKPLSAYVGQVPYISGCSILGNGSISLILDVNSVMRDSGTAKDSKTDEAALSQSSRVTKRVTFSLGDQQYALDINQVKEIIRVPAMSQVGMANSEVLGVFSLRDSLLPVFDLSRYLGHHEAEIGEDSRIIVMKGTADGHIGVLVDSVAEVFNMPENEVEPTPSSIGSEVSRYIRGIHKKGDNLTFLLQADALLDAVGCTA